MYLKEGGQDYDIMAWSEVRIIHDILTSMRNIFILSILFSRNNIVFSGCDRDGRLQAARGESRNNRQLLAAMTLK